MKIILLTVSLELGGAEHRALNLARYFKQRGFYVELWGFNGPGIISEYCLNDGILCKLIPFQWAVISTITLKSFKRLLNALIEAKADVLLPHTVLPIMACGLIWRWSGTKKCIAYVGGNEFGLISRMGEFIAAHLVSGYICNAQHLKRALVRAYSLAPKKITVIRNGISLPAPLNSRKTWRENLSVGEDVFLAAMVANLSWFKNQEGLLRAWQLVLNHLPQKVKEAKLLLAGQDFGTGARLRALVGELGIEQDVLFLGQVRDVTGLLAAVDLCTFSSQNEGCPNGILEAMANGLAVVAVDNEGVREAVGEHQYDWLSAFGDYEGFAQHIINLMSDEHLRLVLGKRNQQRVKDEFSYDIMCKSTEELISRF